MREHTRAGRIPTLAIILTAALSAAVLSAGLGSVAPALVFGASPLIATGSPPPRPGPSRLISTPRPSRSGFTNGIDVSHWQGVIDWRAVRAAGKRFAYIKASDGTTFVDDRYATNRAQAKAAGLVVGAYHFAKPSALAGDAVAEADHFVATAAWVKGELLPVLDLESTGGLSTVALTDWAKAFLGRVYATTGVRAVIYVSPTFWSTRLADTRWFADNGYQVLWIAHWTSGSPTVPASNWGSKGWTFWQYSSTGTVPGIDGPVDLDRYRGTDLTRVRIP